MIYPSIRIEGNIISPDILAKLEEGDYPGQLARDFGFENRAKMKDEIAFAWAMAKDYWRIFQRKIERLPQDATATSETRADWMKPFLELLGYQMELSRAEILNEKSYAISHRDASIGGFPIHIMGYRDDLDKKRAEGGPRMSPHGLLQEYLNISEDLYGLVSNGRYLRLLRDSGRLVKLSYAEFDLNRMMEDDLYADFAIMYRLLHRSRMPKAKELGAESFIERYHQDSLDAGSRIREGLSNAVEQSIILLANGFLRHPANDSLRIAIEEKHLIPDVYYLRLLRLIYRFLFLMVTEERDLIFLDGNGDGREIYYNYYSLQKLRRLSEKRRYQEGRFDDLWEGLKTTFRFFESKTYGERIGILPLDGDLFGADALGEIAESRLKNDVLLECIRDLSEFSDEKGVRIRVNYGSLDVEEFGSVYEGLLEYDPSLTTNSEGWSFQFIKGDKRSSSGSHYTPEELVQPLIKHSLDYVIEEKLKAGAGVQDEEAARAAKRDALLSIKVCDVACGSGHILLSAARRIATVLAQVTTDEEQPSPTSFRTAIREVIRHCIYGVDKNPLAVELCKVALWLEAHNPGMPLTFLDHRIRNGDSIVGIGRIDELHNGVPTEAFRTLPGDDKEVASELRKQNKEEVAERISPQLKLYDTEVLSEAVKAIASDYLRFGELSDSSVEDFHRKRDEFQCLHGAKWILLGQIADLKTAQFFIPKTVENKAKIATDARYVKVVTNRNMNYDPSISKAQETSLRKVFFHWFLEFPEVFEQGGFDCILGNPPFLGGQRLSGTYGDNYLHYLRKAYEPIGAVDLVTYFFRRAFDVLAPKGFQALLATNSIAQGDAREGGLDVIVQRGGTINYAVRSMRWPGAAAVEVAQVAIHKGKWNREFVIGFKPVAQISTYLDDDEELGKPFVLKQNENRSFQGSIVLGRGFVLTPEQAQRLIAVDAKNKDVLFPYLNGEDLNSRPDQSPSRWVINFFDWPLDRGADGIWNGAIKEEQADWLRSGHVPNDYPGKVAADYPNCLQIIERLAKPERMEQDDSGGKNYWWRFLRMRGELYRTIASLERVLAIALTSKTVAFAFMPSKIVFSHAVGVLATDKSGMFTVLQSSLHYHWAWKFASSMKGDLRYTPSDVFETFPLPSIAPDLDPIGEKYCQLRERLTESLNIGLTDLYRLFHNSKLTQAIITKETKQAHEVIEQAYQDILELRQLHKEMDEAVSAAYGWSVLDLEHGFHEVEYLPENDRIRYTISEVARKEVLKRLLKLNHEIHEEEVEKGLWKEKKGKVSGRVEKRDNNTKDLFEG